MFQAFPWPAGKAPWLKKNGGSGVVPDGALENVLSGFRQIHKETGESNPACKLPAPEDVPTPRNLRVCTGLDNMRDPGILDPRHFFSPGTFTRFTRFLHDLRDFYMILRDFYAIARQKI